MHIKGLTSVGAWTGARTEVAQLVRQILGVALLDDDSLEAEDPALPGRTRPAGLPRWRYDAKRTVGLRVDDAVQAPQALSN